MNNEGWRFTAEQEQALWPLKEGGNVIKGKKIRLRMPTRDEVIQFQKDGGVPVHNREELFKATVFCLQNLYGRTLLAHTLKDDTKIGSVTFADVLKNNTIYFGIDVEPEFQNKGYGQEMVTLGVEYARKNYKELVGRLLLLVETDNDRAIHVYEKAGFNILQEGIYKTDKKAARRAYVMEIPL